MIETCDHGNICHVTVWSSLELSRMNNKIQTTENKIIIRVLKDDDSGFHLFYCSAGGRVSFFFLDKQ